MQCGQGVIILNRVTREVFRENMTPEYRNEGNEGGSQAGIRGKCSTQMEQLV